jgi:hypothetical protein
MKPTDLDPSLAFTVLLELDPEMRERTSVEGYQVRQQLLDAYYAQDAIRNLWDFTRWYLGNPPRGVHQPGPPPRLVGDYIGRLRRIAELKKQVMQLESAALGVHNLLREQGAQIADIERYHALAYGDQPW